MLMYVKSFFTVALLQLAGGPNPSPEKAPVLPAPVAQTIDFGAISDGKKVVVSWSIFNQRSFDYFTIERSKDGVNFVSALMIKGSGKTSTQVDYTDVDYQPFTGVSYYRLKQTDYSGESFFSETIAVNYQVNKDGSFTLNTSKGLDAEELEEIADKPLLVVMKDQKGEEFVSRIVVSGENGQLYATDTRNQIGKGSYFVVAASFNRLCCQKLTIR
jgi:hypothetical protein